MTQSMLRAALVVALVVLHVLCAVPVAAHPQGTTRDYGDSLHWLARGGLSGESYDMAWNGDYVYVSDDAVGLHVMQVTDDGFDEVRTVSVGGEVLTLTHAGSWLAAGTDEDGLFLLNTSVPDDPGTPAQVFADRGVWHTTWMGNYLAAAVEDSLWIVEIHPGPTVIAKVDLPYDADRLAYDIDRDLLYAASADGVHIFDVADPFAPAELGLYDGHDYIIDVAVRPETSVIYALQDDGDLLILETSTPATPVLLQTTAVGPNPTRLLLVDNVLWVGTGETLEAYNATTSHLGGQLDHMTTSSRPYGMTSHDGLLACDMGYTIDLFDMGDLSAPVDTVVTGPNDAVDAVFDGDYIYGLTFGGDFVVQKPQHTTPEATLHLASTHGAKLVAGSGGRFFAIHSGGALVDIDAAIPTAPSINGSAFGLGSIWDLAHDGTDLWLAMGDAGLIGIDTSVPGYLAPTSGDSPGGYALAVGCGNGLVFLGMANGNLLIYDATDLEPGPVGSIYIGDAIKGIDWYGNRVHLVTGAGQYAIVDVHRPDAPTLVAEMEFTERVFNGLTVVEDVAYIAADGDGIWAVDVSTLTAPEHVGRLGTSDYCLSVCACPTSGYQALVAAVDGVGFVVAPLHEADLSPAADTPALMTQLPPNRPNPFNPRTEFNFTLTVDGPTELAIYDVRGCKVAVLVDAQLAAGEHVAVWDGHNQAGAACAAGAYVARLETVAGRATRKISLVK